MFLRATILKISSIRDYTNVLLLYVLHALKYRLPGKKRAKFRATKSRLPMHYASQRNNKVDDFMARDQTFPVVPIRVIHETYIEKDFFPDSAIIVALV